MKYNEIAEEYKTARQLFNESWLKEMPMGLNQSKNSDNLKHMRTMIHTLNENTSVIDLGNNFYKIELGNIMYYWYGQNIDMAVELTKTFHTLQVNMIDKNYTGHPYASDLYVLVLKDKDTNLRFQSDTLLSDDGLGIWKRLIKSNLKVSVYDIRNPGKTFTPIESEEELLKYFKHNDTSYRNYQYILSETLKNTEVKIFFNMRKRWEENGQDDL